jgi:hypothetical protein
MLREQCHGGETATTAGRRSASTERAPSHLLVALQRRAGNRAVAGALLAVQRHYTNNAADFVNWITTHPEFTRYARLSSGEVRHKCHDAATAVQKVILDEKIPVSAHVFFVWKHGDEAPGDHLVVVATVAATPIVVDPTRHQFEGGTPCAMPEAQWRKEFLAAVRPAGVAVRVFTGAESAALWVDNFTNLLKWRGTAASIGAELLRPPGRKRTNCVIL